jgi:hypothetical protein
MRSLGVRRIRRRGCGEGQLVRTEGGTTETGTLGGAAFADPNRITLFQINQHENKSMSADKDRGIRRQKQKRAKDSKRKHRKETSPVGTERAEPVVKPAR